MPESQERSSAQSPLQRALRVIRRDRAAMLGLVIFLGLAGLAIVAERVAPYDPAAVHVRDRLQGRRRPTGSAPTSSDVTC